MKNLRNHYHNDSEFPHDEFDTHLAGHGLFVPQEKKYVMDEVVRFAGCGKGGSNLAGWVIKHSDSGRATFGDHSSGLHEEFVPEKYTPKGENFFKPKKLNISKSLNEEWQGCKPVNEVANFYLKKKRISAGIAKSKDEVSLVLPIINMQKKLTSFQYIFKQDGKIEKRFKKGGQIKGCFIPITKRKSNPEDPFTDDPLIICEGFATGMSISEVPQFRCANIIAALSSGNLMRVAEKFRLKYPDREIVIFGDNDHSSRENIGKAKAMEAAQKIHARCLLPNFSAKESDLSDFNDLWTTIGRENFKFDKHIKIYGYRREEQKIKTE